MILLCLHRMALVHPMLFFFKFMNIELIEIKLNLLLTFGIQLIIHSGRETILGESSWHSLNFEFEKVQPSSCRPHIFAFNFVERIGPLQLQTNFKLSIDTLDSRAAC